MNMSDRLKMASVRKSSLCFEHNSILILFVILTLKLASNDLNQYLLKQSSQATRYISQREKGELSTKLATLLPTVECVQLPEVLKIGGLFERGEENLVTAFRLAIEQINNWEKNKLLPKTKLVPVVETLDKSDSFVASRKVCHILQDSLVGIFGPQSSKSSNYARSVCSSLQLPHFETRWDTSLPDPMPYSINLAPEPSILGRALCDLVVKKNWKTFGILYSEDSSMILIGEILKHEKMLSKQIVVRKARDTLISGPSPAGGSDGPNGSGNNNLKQRAIPQSGSQPRPSFKGILKELGKLQLKNLIVDVPRDQVSTVLSHAREVGMLGIYNSYIFTTLDLHTVDLTEYYTYGSNISAFSIIDPKQLQSHESLLKEWREAPLTFGDRSQESAISLDQDDSDAQNDPSATTPAGTILVQPSDGSKPVTIMRNLTTEAALLFDGVELLARSLAELNKTNQLIKNELQGPVNFPLTSSCVRKTSSIGNSGNQIAPWSIGSLLRGFMQNVRFSGLTGEIGLHERGNRSQFMLHLHDLTREGLKSVANWTLSSGLNYVGNYSSVISANVKDIMQNKTLYVVTLLNRPYVMRVKDFENKTGNDRWEGYCIDLIYELSKQLNNFTYEIRVLDEPIHGARGDKGEWNGLIRELIDGKADISVADLTITYERESVVDFTMPFMSLGIGILVKKPTKASPKLFEFMLPLAPEVWIYLITVFVGVTLFLFIIARFSPYEWQNPHPCEREAEELSNDFTMKNTLWFTIGCLMQQGCDIMPGALSTRVMAAAWWFFILIIVSSYTANLAAFLTVERMDNPIQSADDLAKQTKVLYGCLKGGSTRAFFQQSNYTTYARMWSFMESRRAETLLESNSKGVERVIKGDFAFLMESTTIEYTVERHCDLSQVGSLLDQKGYGIATQQESPYRVSLSEAILVLQERGVLRTLKDRWWKERKEDNRSCEVREQQKSSGTASELGLDHVGGVFLVLGAGALISIIICIGEFYWKHIKTPRQERDHLLTQLAREFKQIFVSGNRRPLRSRF